MVHKKTGRFDVRRHQTARLNSYQQMLIATGLGLGGRGRRSGRGRGSRRGTMGTTIGRSGTSRSARSGASRSTGSRSAASRSGRSAAGGSRSTAVLTRSAAARPLHAATRARSAAAWRRSAAARLPAAAGRFEFTSRSQDARQQGGQRKQLTTHRKSSFGCSETGQNSHHVNHWISFPAASFTQRDDFHFFSFVKPARLRRPDYLSC